VPKMRALKITPKAKAYLPLAITCGTILIGLLAFFSNLVGRSFNSDDVAEQAMAHNFVTSPHHSLQVQVDTYFIKYPVYWLFGLLTHPSITQVAIESILFNVLMIILLWVWWRKFSPAAPITWLVFAWLLACGTYWMTQTINPNTRNLELPLMLLIGCFAATGLESLTQHGYTLNRRVVAFAVGFAIVSGLLVYDDPYLLFFILLPLGLATLLYVKGKNILRPVSFVTLGLVISLGVFKLLGIIASHYGVHFTKFNEINDLGSSIVSSRYLPTKVLYTMEGYLSLFGISVSGASLNTWRFLAGLPGLSIVFLAIWALCSIIRRRIFSLFNLWIIMVIIFTFFYVIITGTPLVNTLRYLIILVPLTALLAVHGLTDLQKRRKQLYRVTVWLISLSLICNLIVAAINLNEHSQNPKPDQGSYSLIAALKRSGVENIYTNYWTANITYYLSDYHDNALPTVCYYGKIYKDPALVDSDRFNFSGERTGVVVTPNLVVPTNSPYPQSPSCTVSATMQQFGKPQEIIQVAPSVLLLIYNHPLYVPWRQY
jgi:hypothetical protein